MILLDENIPDEQRLLLSSWRIRARQIGFDFGRSGMLDDEIITMLRRRRQYTFSPMTKISMIDVCATPILDSSTLRSIKVKAPFISESSCAIPNLTHMKNGWGLLHVSFPIA